MFILCPNAEGFVKKMKKIMNRKKSHKNGGAGVWWDSGIVKKKVIYVNGNYMGEEQQSNQ